MLALRELTLSHFRSHKVARLSLDGRPVAIHGRNGAGKTNISGSRFDVVARPGSSPSNGR